MHTVTRGRSGKPSELSHILSMTVGATTAMRWTRGLSTTGNEIRRSDLGPEAVFEVALRTESNVRTLIPVK
jgi:hypothetical protein